MIKENWRAIVLTLLAANLVFIVLLELQRRTMITRQREFTQQIEQVLVSGEIKTRAQVSEIEMRTKDTYERVIMMQGKLNEIGMGTKEASERVTMMQGKLNEIGMGTKDASERVTMMQGKLNEIGMGTKDTYERVIMMQGKLNEIGSRPAPR